MKIICRKCGFEDEQQIEKRNEANNGVVIFLDALGAREFSLDECRTFISDRDEILNRSSFIWNKWTSEFQKELDKKLPEPEIVAFQDSIIICFAEQSGNSLPPLLAAGQWLTQMMTQAIFKGIFFRGSISVGPYIFDTSPKNVTVMGPAVSDAYLYHDKAKWIGVIQTPKCQNNYQSVIEFDAKERKEKLNPKFYEFLFVDYPVPFGDGKKERCNAVSWPHIACRAEKKLGNPIISSVLSEGMCKELDTAIKQKYKNSLTFLRWYEKYIFPNN
ncbi:hypothetical protein [uncultured Methanoregula sp.]|uniref:hypothetical protein n=1 Tax=uncultured Methanoregula sp. TaxID=1005933 RepID=UPI002AAA7FA2|nr:hypothetical protein [uncultured Methanoregula sp.]